MTFPRALLAAVLVLACLPCGGCDKKSEHAAPPPSAPATAPSPVASAAPSSSVAADGPTGTVRGRVVFKGKTTPAKNVDHPRDPFCEKAKPKEARVTRVGAGNGLLDAVVRVAPGTVQGDAKLAPRAVITQKGCMYEPRVQGVVAGTILELRNDDRTMHNIHGFAQGPAGSGEPGDTVFNAGQAMGAPPIEKPAPTAPGVVRVKCDVHPWMLAWLVVSDHPFFASTTNDGSFTLERVPVGAREIEAVHPLHGSKVSKVDVKEGAITTVDFTFTEADKAP